MNERIKELAEQCYTTYRNGHGGYTEQFDEEKFAELIIRECAEACMKEIDIGWAVAPKSPWMAKQILEHFGME